MSLKHSVLLLCLAGSAVAQTTSAPPSAADRAATAAASAAERDRELKLLGISAVQPAMTAYDIGKPENANYDEAKANPYPHLPDVLKMNDGSQVITAAQRSKRKAEIKALFDENIYGKYPASIPTVTWKVDGIAAANFYRWWGFTDRPGVRARRCVG